MSEQKRRGAALLECCQEIPCNPCATVCKTGAITKASLNARPEFHPDKCVGCKLCVAACPGQAIFLETPDYEPGKWALTFPYEYRPLPEEGQTVTAVDRLGQPVCQAVVAAVEDRPVYNKTVLVTLVFPAEHREQVRFMKRLEQEGR
ncbi:4Fe-4S binding protein [Pseudoflavonifractor sp. 524-17]|uniref:4Fe-4S binding protein n=1 Tax=Pseudoflavonifractor sp. 524-17 TaxID=2304577 RepID=UPI00137B5A9D|nr:4Fe-4S binding protein [Pseudoflavonifractor sp. 524-17]